MIKDRCILPVLSAPCRLLGQAQTAPLTPIGNSFVSLVLLLAWRLQCLGCLDQLLLPWCLAAALARCDQGRRRPCLWQLPNVRAPGVVGVLDLMETQAEVGNRQLSREPSQQTSVRGTSLKVTSVRSNLRPRVDRRERVLTGGCVRTVRTQFFSKDDASCL